MNEQVVTVGQLKGIIDRVDNNKLISYKFIERAKTVGRRIRPGFGTSSVPVMKNKGEIMVLNRQEAKIRTNTTLDMKLERDRNVRAKKVRRPVIRKKK